VFKLNRDCGGFRVLYNFGGPDGSNLNDGQKPLSGLIEASDGVLYGTTSSGGLSSGNSAGVVFKVTKDGTGYHILRNFTTIGGDGANPSAGLLEWSDGALYGTPGYGTLFKSFFGGHCG
jgi:hypothetical protein